MQAPHPPPETDRANELYWDSELSVKQIADELDVSRGILYGLIEPLGAVHPCPDCGAEVTWVNRTARAKGTLTCTSCGWEGSAEPEADAAPTGARGSRLMEVMGAHRVRVAAGGALLGAAAGLALVLWRRRR